MLSDTDCDFVFVLSLFARDSRTFGGTPSVSSGQTNAVLLRQALSQAGKTFDLHTYIGAGYDSFFSLTHHNEIWIYAAWQQETSDSQLCFSVSSEAPLL